MEVIDVVGDDGLGVACHRQLEQVVVPLRLEDWDAIGNERQSNRPRQTVLRRSRSVVAGVQTGRPSKSLYSSQSALPNNNR